MSVIRCLLLPLGLLVLSGCGGEVEETVQWSGAVTYEGEPVESGSVRFEPVEGEGQTAGAPIIRGEYSVELIPGKYNLEITGRRQVGEKPAYGEGSETVPTMEDLGTSRETVEVNEDAVRDFSLEES